MDSILKNSNEKVVLWTRQDKRMVDILEKDGIFRIKKEYIVEKNEDISDYYLKLYDWYVKKANEIVPKPSGATYPIWCSVDEKYMLRKIDDTVVIKLETDKSNIVFFDSTRWDYVLNHMYIPKDEEDQRKFRQLLKERGIHDEFSLVEGRYARFYPDIRQKIIDSWDRVFEIKKWNMFLVQANIWELKKEWILDIS